VRVVEVDDAGQVKLRLDIDPARSEWRCGKGTAAIA